MYRKNNGRTTYKSNRRPSFKKTGGYQNYRNRNKGNVSQLYNKYLKLAKEAFRSGDRVQSEYYYQFTDHYYRLMIELGISIEENIVNEDVKSTSDETIEDSQTSSSTEIDDDRSDDSIESIPFIADPSKEKRTRSIK